ncbi:MAG: tyrosine-type recombinase/integrase [Victivallaceae bacterium]|jgi:integrase
MHKKIKLSTLIAQTEQAVDKISISDRMKKNYHYEGFKQIQCFYEENGLVYYDKKILMDFVWIARAQYEDKAIEKSKFLKIRKTVYLLSEYYNTGRIQWKHLRSWPPENLCDRFQQILMDFSQYMSVQCNLSEGTCMGYRSNASLLLSHLESKLGLTDLNKLNFSDISAFLDDMIKRRPVSMRSLLDGLRKFGCFLLENKIIELDILPALIKKTARRRKHKPSFSNDEVEKILSAPDRKTAVGKRDYSMFLLADRLGLRACDICTLRFENLDWNKRELHFIQNKTNILYSAPLDTTVLNAIADYILNARPEADLPYIFIRHTRPYDKLQYGTLGNLLYRYMNQVGIYVSGDYKLMHAFRRKFGIDLLKAEIPASEISKALGHTNLDTLWPYIAADIEHLRLCPLDLSNVMVSREELR